MTRLFALTLATLFVATGPVAALSIPAELPRLSFPEQPDPVTTQGCADMTTLNGEICVISGR
ncbi:hypothetical protein ACJ5NV_17895 [Loktanella agnita]|uniref:hypothetical protein n=1 Tax=Loktanella agnita TaxID=287097 RepID=UPI003988D49F